MTNTKTAAASLDAFTLASIPPNGCQFQLLTQSALRRLEARGLVVVGRDLIARTAAAHTAISWT